MSKIINRRFHGLAQVWFCVAVFFLLSLMLPATDTRAQETNLAPTAVVFTNADTVEARENDAKISVSGGARITLDGSRSSDPEGGALTYSWGLLGGPGGFEFTEVGTGATYQFTAPARLGHEQILLYQLIVSDPLDTSNPEAPTIRMSELPNGLAQVIVLSLGSNRAPVVSAGESREVHLGDTITLDGSVTDPDGDELDRYIWIQSEGPDLLAQGPFKSDELNPTITIREDVFDHLLGGGEPDADGVLGRLTFTLTVVDTPRAGQPPLSGFGNVTLTVVERPLVTDVDVQKTVETINGFLNRRTSLVLANQPRAARRISRLQQGTGTGQLAFTPGDLAAITPFFFDFLSLGSGTYNFSTSLDQATRAADTMTVLAAGDNGSGTAGHTRRRMDVWFDGSLHKVSGSGDASGTFGIAHLGADWLVSPDLLVGAMVQYDSLSESSDALNYRVEGKGWMVGPYATARLLENLYLDGRLAWGQSDDEISPQKTYTDEFTSERWLATVGLSGHFSGNVSGGGGDASGASWTLQPNISLSYMADRQKSYVNSLNVTIPGQTLSRGQVQMGPNFSTRFVGPSGMIFEPSFTLDAIYSHAETRGVTLTRSTDPDNGWRARVEPGLTMTNANGDVRASITGNYDGIGQSGFESWGVGINAGMRF